MMMKIIGIVITLTVLLLVSISSCISVDDEDKKIFNVDLKDILFVVLSQPNSYHIERADVFKQHLDIEVAQFISDTPTIRFLHEQWPTYNSWTIFPILSDIVHAYGHHKWVVFCDAETRFHLKELLYQIAFFDHSKLQFLGQGLEDSSSAIIHHYHQDKGFQFPNFFAGFAMSMPLVRQLTELLDEHAPIRDFTIDLKHEIALYIYTHVNGTRLTSVPFLCAGKAAELNKSCATYLTDTFPQCGEPIAEDDLHIAVKTCAKYHESRIPVCQKTWAKDAKHVVFYSEVENASIPTVSLGIPNTVSGHCAKLYGILQRFHQDKNMATMNWLIVVDDDTLLSVHLLRRLLKCYNPSERVVLGERYGYALWKKHGYSYPTGGSGMVFSRPAVEAIIKCPYCNCPTASSPDDMCLGTWLKALHIPVTHSSSFHQARPDDYTPEYLHSQQPVSFHKHWNCNPYEVYRDWLDKPQLNETPKKHVEL